MISLRLPILLLLLVASVNAQAEAPLPFSPTSLLAFLLIALFAFVFPLIAMLNVLKHSNNVKFTRFVVICTALTYLTQFLVIFPFLAWRDVLLAMIVLLDCVLLVSVLWAISHSYKKTVLKTVSPIDNRKWIQMATLLKSMGYSSADAEMQLVERGLDASAAGEVVKSVFANT